MHTIHIRCHDAAERHALKYHNLMLVILVLSQGRDFLKGMHPLGTIAHPLVGCWLPAASSSKYLVRGCTR